MARKLLLPSIIGVTLTVCLTHCLAALAFKADSAAGKINDRITFKTKIDQLLSKYGATGPYGRHFIKISEVLPNQDNTLYSLKDLVPVKPASNLKLFTTMLALHKWGGDFKYQTHAIVQIKSEPGQLFASLLPQPVAPISRIITIQLKGAGDSSWMSQFLTSQGNHNGSKNFLLWLEKIIKQQNPTPYDRIQIYLDDRGFEQKTLPPTWNPANFAECYSAESGAFNYENNCDWLEISPASKINQPASVAQINRPGYTLLINKTKTVDSPKLQPHATQEESYEYGQEDLYNSNQELPSYESKDPQAREWRKKSGNVNQNLLANEINNCPNNEPLWVNQIELKKNKQELTVSGEVPLKSGTTALRFAIHNPTHYLSTTIQQYLRTKGLPSALFLTEPQFEEQQYNLSTTATSYTYLSPSLADFIFYLNKVSQNHLAENIFRSLSYQNEAPNENPASWNNSIQYAQTALKNIYGIDTTLPTQQNEASAFGINTLVDGSGLSHENKVTVAALHQLLVKQTSLPTYPIFYKSLPIAGIDGSLGGRMKTGCYLNDTYISDNKACGLFNNVRAKTGYISGVVSLSGYMQNFEGKKIAFSLVSNNVNDSPCALSFVRSRIHEQVLAELYRTKL